jgi:hypothetical protein
MEENKGKESEKTDAETSRCLTISEKSDTKLCVRGIPSENSLPMKEIENNLKRLSESDWNFELYEKVKAKSHRQLMINVLKWGFRGLRRWMKLID